jgi:hypothetical protein
MVQVIQGLVIRSCAPVCTNYESNSKTSRCCDKSMCNDVKLDRPVSECYVCISSSSRNCADGTNLVSSDSQRCAGGTYFCKVI